MRGEEAAKNSLEDAGCRWGTCREDPWPDAQVPRGCRIRKRTDHKRSSTRRVREWEEPGPHRDKFLDWKNCGLHVIGSNDM